MYLLRVTSAANIVEIEENHDDLDELMEAAKTYLEDFGPYNSVIEISQVN